MLREGAFIVDRYEIIEKVGSGGMSDVYKAKDHKLNRYVAIKVMKQEFSKEQNFISKFRVEAQSAAGLAHPNIVSVYDVGEEDGIYFIVMELVEGITLKRYIEKKGRLSVKEAISIAIQVSMGIETAHRNHIIHRDIKPQNIIISKEGKVKVADFGIAKAATSNTISSNVMGSVHYTSPEQAKGGYSDEKSDIYSLGITIFEMLTGRVPFDGDTTVSIAVKHIEEKFPLPSSFVEDIPYSVEQIIRKCTQKKRERRYGNMTALIADLKRSLVEPDGDFVVIAMEDATAPTRAITEEEVNQIKRETGKVDLSDISEEAFEETEATEEMNPKLEKIMTVLAIVAAVIIVFIAVYLVGTMLGIFGKNTPSQKESATTTTTTKEVEDEELKMISVLGMTFDEATESLNKMGLGIKKNATMENSDIYEEGQIMAQSVDEGEAVEENTTIVVTISAGELKLEMIDVVGMDKETAKKRLEEEIEAKVTEDYAYSDTVAEGEVISTSPKEGSTISKGEKVTMVISSGPKPAKKVTVPSLTGGNHNSSTAKNALKNYGLTLGNVTEEYSDTVVYGIVMEQSVQAGQSVEEGTAIDVVVSKGPKPETEKIYTGSLTVPAANLPAEFTSGNVKLELTQTVNGSEKVTTIFEGTLSKTDFPYTKTITGASGVKDGVVRMYIDGELVSGSVSVTFKAAE